ncbi:type II secretion system F family protein [Haloplanus aerogenes]|uniref:Archaellum biogenesis protein FlaJ (TadC family) n=2 Tax=Haloplanus aerogenes TaxID=660522 RepID=A0A3M0DQ35_9EURY|nr:type II secretion system F family protein [Haloplanus aerogenes]RMB23822.1 archaellum biogenesis protein FlaJ (TadC family) [Haloplanus aerogenes]
MLYALFARHADDARHVRDRKRYRGTDMRLSFDVYLARVYGLSWLVALAVTLPTAVVAVTLADAVPVSVAGVVGDVVPFARFALPMPPTTLVMLVVGLAVGGITKTATVRLGGGYLRWLANARRNDIERTLPGAARYLHVLSSGGDDHRTMLRKVADTEPYGETAVSVRKVLNTASLTGSLHEGLRRIARDTPSRELLAPFLLKFSEHAQQGEAELANYLRMESRMLAHRQDRARQRAAGLLELLSEVFMVLLVLPTLLVIVLTVLAIISPALSEPITTPLGTLTVRALVVYTSALFVLGLGIGASVVVGGLRPPGQTVEYDRPAGALATLASTPHNPASAAVVALLPALVVAAVLHTIGYPPADVALLGYAAYALPVGVVGVRRARLDDAKDREIKDFVHAVSGHVNLGRPFPQAVELVARDVDFGPLDPDVADLALNLGFTSPETGIDENVRTAALERFVETVGTPLAEQTVGLVTGALDSGSDAGTVFDTLQTEIGRLYHEKRELRANLLAYVAVGWTTALLVVGIAVAVGLHVFDGFEQLASVRGPSGYVIEGSTIDMARERYRLYIVTQSTMLASGWFAGTASRGRYEALLHSGALVVVCHVVFAGVGMI